MGLLDPDRVRAALGPRLGDKFLQYATAPLADGAACSMPRGESDWNGDDGSADPSNPDGGNPV